MEKMMKPIKFSQHAKEQLEFRGATKKEIIETIKTAKWIPAELGRIECKKDFVFDEKWNEKYFKSKQVRSIFVEEEKEIVVVTVYTYYF